MSKFNVHTKETAPAESAELLANAEKAYCFRRIADDLEGLHDYREDLRGILVFTDRAPDSDINNEPD